MAKRTDTTLWRLLVWAYRDQLVRRSGRDVVLTSSNSSTGLACGAMRTGIVASGGSPLTAAVPEDALTVEAVAGQLTRADYRLLVQAAESGAPPDWNPKLPPPGCRPRRRDNGKIAMLYRRPHKRDEPYASLVEFPFGEAWAAGRRAEARALYHAFHTALVRLYPVLGAERALLRWRVAGLGLPAWPWQNKLDIREKT